MLDGDHYRTAELVNQLTNNAQWRATLDLIESLRPMFFKSDGKWVYKYGVDDEDSAIIGRGDTPAEAMMDFHSKFFNQKAS